MGERRVGILGATSFVGRQLLPRLTALGCELIAYSRSHRDGTGDGVEWRRLDAAESQRRLGDEDAIPFWICVAPIWILPEHLSLLDAARARRVVALSSTSRFTKEESGDPGEQDLAHRLAQAEQDLQAWADRRGVEWVILRPTLIYGFGQDRNITEIARFIGRFGFFPVFGSARGLRQPVHVVDVATTCATALLKEPRASCGAYDISGSETLSYREMVSRVFTAMGRPTRLVMVPLWLFRLAIKLVRIWPRYRGWTTAMAERMNRSLVFDHSDAARDLEFTPRRFSLTAEDVPRAIGRREPTSSC